MTLKTYSVFSGDRYDVVATSPAEAIAKYAVAYGYQGESDFEDLGFDFSNLDGDVTEGEADTTAEEVTEC